MNEEKLNISIRKFLKNVGINSQRLIEDKVRNLVKDGEISNSKKIKIKANIVCEDLNLSNSIDGEIDIEI
tara:strand:+ start:188 stop:397 length:210 start_codon:yes stop_codon:yes gene_type:complete